MSPKTVKSGARVVQVLELFMRHRHPMSATDICASLGYPKSSANLLLHTLVESGWLSLDAETMRYFPTLRVAALGDWLPAQLYGGEQTDMLVQQLHRETQETTTLSIPNGVHMEFVRIHVGTFPISLNVPAGSKVPMFGTAVGTAYLQTHSDDVIDRLYQRAVVEEALADSSRTLGDYLTEIRQARKRGYAVGYDRLLSDTGAIGVCLFAGGQEYAVVLGVGGLSSRIARSEAAISKLMVRLARQAQRQAGHKPDR